MNRHPSVITKPPITANNRVDFFRQNAVVIGEMANEIAIDKELIIPRNKEKVLAKSLVKRAR